MLLSASPGAEALITADLGKALSNQLDRAVLCGAGSLQPLGIANHPDTHKIAFDATWWGNLTESQYQCASTDVSERFSLTESIPSATPKARNYGFLLGLGDPLGLVAVAGVLVPDGWAEGLVIAAGVLAGRLAFSLAITTSLNSIFSLA
jgi:hypothetical protein